MITNAQKSNNKQSNVIHESWLTKIFDITSLQLTLILECISWAAVKIIIALMINSAKANKNLTQKLSKIVGEPWVVNIMPNDKVVNAFCTFGTNNIFITSGLVKKLELNEKETLAIMLHEVGHGQEKYAYLIRGIPNKLTQYTVIRFSILLLKIYGNNPMAGYAVGIVQYLLSALGIYPVSRFYEYRADAYAVEKGYGKPFISAIKKLLGYIKKEAKAQGFTPPQDPAKAKSVIVKLVLYLQELFSTHPNTYKRIARAEEKLAKMEKGQKPSTNLASSSAKLMKAANIDTSGVKLSNIISKFKKLLSK